MRISVLNRLQGLTVHISPEHNHVVEQELLRSNSVRLCTFAWMVLLFNIVTFTIIAVLFPDIALEAGGNSTGVILLIIRIVLLASSILFLVARTRINDNALQKLLYSYLFLVLISMATHASVFQAIRPLIAPYIIALFASSAFVYMNSLQAACMFIPPLILFVVLQFFFQADPVLLISNNIHVVGMTIVAFVASRVTYNFKVREILAQLHIKHMSRTDQLTGLPNRRAMEEIFSKEWRRCERDNKPLALLMLDVDHFKKFNDRHGHQQGDECLRQIARALQAQMHRSGDEAVRYGGEEFLAVLPDTDVAGAALIAERIRHAVEDLRLPLGNGSNDVVTISIGVAHAAPAAGVNVRDVLRSADNALYAAKERGRNRVMLAQDLGDVMLDPAPRAGALSN